MSTSPITSKEKGNAAFKTGDYAAAIGHYTAAALADPSDPTFFLNRAAAYLKLSKNQDAERDCTTVLGLSNNKNVKALYRRAQARVALQKLGEAHNDLQTALKLEPNSEAVKVELARVDGLIVSGKAKSRSAPIEVSAPLSTSSPPSSAAPPKRRRVPIAIIDDDASPPPSTSATSAHRADGDLLNPISSRALSPSTAPSPKLTPEAAPSTQKPKPTSFTEAKQARDAKSVGRVGGGIFRMSGNDTVFKTREVPAPAPTAADPPPPKGPDPATTIIASAPIASVAPSTLFEFTRAWDHIPISDTAARWGLLNTHSPASLPALFGASLEPALLASFVPVLAAVSIPAVPGQHKAAPHDAVVRVREFMCALTQVSRFRTVVQFLSRAEQSSARAVWEAVVHGTGNAYAEDAEEVADAARKWGFADA
ncbi:hypothetical protein BC827DRAFT_1237872 [Russula dissimulans]|nr:hypothetical protein BC827DRAFT_1237872 [Russula dissimulans]